MLLIKHFPRELFIFFPLSRKVEHDVSYYLIQYYTHLSQFWYHSSGWMRAETSGIGPAVANAEEKNEKEKLSAIFIGSFFPSIHTYKPYDADD